jgi:hypothetical protein
MMLLLLLALTVFQSQPGSVRTIGKGPTSGIDAARQVAVRSRAEWDALWKAHTSGAALGEQPMVDFARDMVLGVFLGTRPTAGYGVEIVRTVKVNGALRVEYVESAPDRGTITAQVITAPFHLVAVPREDGPVQFVKVDR